MAAPLVIPELAAVGRYAGSSLGCTKWLTIGAERIQRFVRATGAPEALRDDSPPPGDSGDHHAPGELLLALVPGLLPHLLVLEGWNTAVNTGAEDCRFETPVPAGARVRMHARIPRARTVPGGGCRLAVDVEFEVEGSDQPACRARVIYLYYP